MKKKTSPLFSKYIIDGQAMDETPFSALYDSLDGIGTVHTPDEEFEDIVDETPDHSCATLELSEAKLPEYIRLIESAPYNEKKADLSYPATWTEKSINAVLLDLLFREGRFCLQDILLMPTWTWNQAPTGNASAFWESTAAAGRYLFDLGVRLDRYFVEESRKDCTLEWAVRSKISPRRRCPAKADTPLSDSHILYIPFTSGRYFLGGSALSAVLGGGGKDPDPTDADYFLDCYEVVREMVEDGVVKAGIPVGRGGLALAAEKFCRGKMAEPDIRGIIAATGETDKFRILFSEVPGVLMQIADEDLDYVDSQLLLQEVAYYEIAPGRTPGGDNGISFILSSLLRNS